MLRKIKLKPKRAWGGRREGSGRRSAKAVGGRQRMRDLVDNPERWKAFVEKLDADLRAGRSEAFVKCFEHGYGRPPQALDIKHYGESTKTVVHRVQFADGSLAPSPFEGVPAKDPYGPN